MNNLKNNNNDVKLLNMLRFNNLNDKLNVPKNTYVNYISNGGSIEELTAIAEISNNYNASITNLIKLSNEFGYSSSDLEILCETRAEYFDRDIPIAYIGLARLHENQFGENQEITYESMEHIVSTILTKSYDLELYPSEYDVPIKEFDSLDSDIRNINKNVAASGINLDIASDIRINGYNSFSDEANYSEGKSIIDNEDEIYLPNPTPPSLFVVESGNYIPTFEEYLQNKKFYKSTNLTHYRYEDK